MSQVEDRKAERVNSTFLRLFVPFRPLIFNVLDEGHSHRGGNLLYTVYPLKCYSYPDTPSQTHPE